MIRNVSSAFYSSAGSRKRNEDAVAIFTCQDTFFGVIADGIGSLPGGTNASNITLKTLAGDLTNEGISAQAVRDALTDANTRILNDPSFSQSKSTVALLWMEEDDALAANIGDTRIYQIRDGKITFQSADHSVAASLARAGELNPEEVRTSKSRHQLTKALGSYDDPNPDIHLLSVRPGDAFLICSNGFWEMVSETEMLDTLEKTMTDSLSDAAEDPAADWLTAMRGRFDQAAGDNHSAITLIIRG